MTVGSWAYMLLVWSAITAANVFCYSRIFRKKKR